MNVNPITRLDYPDLDVIRVEDTYYMVSTTMHFMPGCEILQSFDLVHWEHVTYVYETLDHTDAQQLKSGQNIYGQGMWAASLRYHEGRFCICFVANDTRKTYLYTSEKIDGPWKKQLIEGFYHDGSLLFDEDGRNYIVYGNDEIWITELNEDLTAPKKDGLHRLLVSDHKNPELGYEGSHIQKINGYYYIFLIHSLRDRWMRTEACFYSDSLEGEFTGGDVLCDDRGYCGQGVAQGGIVDTPDGKWYAMLFQDRGASGRIPYLFSVDWEDGWPVIHRKPIIPEAGEKQQKETGLFAHSFLDEAGKLHKAWQWNHNPLEGCYTLDAASGALRLTTGHLATGLLDARNTMTCRTAEPGCSFAVKLDFGGLKRGDYAGICAFQGKYGQIGVKITRNGPVLLLKQKQGESYGVGKIVPDAESRFDCWTKTLNNENTIYLRIDYAFGPDKDLAYFCYSFDGESWENLGDPLQMRFTLDMFTGYRTGIFCYATEETGGFADYSMVLK